MPVLNRIQIRRGTLAAGSNQWSNQVLFIGELGYESDTGKFKIGDGITTWDSLPYAAVLPSDLNELVQDIIGANLIPGSGISIDYDDNSGNTTISLNDPTIQVADITDLTASAAELNTLDGITASTAELNTLDGITASTAELNTLDGITSTTSELNILDGVTSDYTEINLLDGSIANTVVNSKAVIYGSAGQISASSISTTGNIVVGGNLTVNGTTTSVNSTTITIDDKNLELGSVDVPSDTTADGGGITLKGTIDKEWKWLDATDSWTSTEHININATGLTYKINGTTVLGNLTIGASGYALASGVLIDGGTP